VLCKIALYFLAWPLFQLALCDQNYPAIYIIIIIFLKQKL